MGKVTLVLPERIASVMRGTLREKRETGGVLLVGVADAPDGSLRLLGREFHLVPEDAYERRSPTELVVCPEGWASALARAEQIGSGALWFHTHPGHRSAPFPSLRDRQVDELLDEPFRIRSAMELYGTIILAGTPRQPRFTGQVSRESEPRPIDNLLEVGDRVRLIPAGEPETTRFERDLFDRNVRAFGGAVQDALSGLAVAVVGAGGTGSAVAEQLIRLGVRTLTVFDPDTLSMSNVTRVYGSTPSDVGRKKVDLLAEHLLRIAPDAQIRTVSSPIINEAAARRLIGSDVVFGCTDDNAGRLVLSRFASYLLAVVIDCGVLLSSNADGSLSGIDARVTVLTPGTACLVCRHRVDLARAQAELLPDAELARLQREGYAAALPGVEPAVVAFTTAVAAAAVGELLERLVGYGPRPAPSEVLLRLHEREMSANSAAPRDGHYCDPKTGKLGLGSGTPFLEQTWGA